MLLMTSHESSACSGRFINLLLLLLLAFQSYILDPRRASLHRLRALPLTPLSACLCLSPLFILVAGPLQQRASGWAEVERQTRERERKRERARKESDFQSRPNEQANEGTLLSSTVSSKAVFVRASSPPLIVDYRLTYNARALVRLLSLLSTEGTLVRSTGSVR